MICVVLRHGWLLISASSCSGRRAEILHLVLGVVVVNSNIVLAVVEQVVCWVAAAAKIVIGAIQCLQLLSLFEFLALLHQLE